jgi:predicted enzyme related to lactoylglutathione lyase
VSRVQLSINVSDFDAAVAFYINHLGVEVSPAEDVTQAETRLSAAGLATEARPGTTCCYALQDKVRAHDPDGLAWEYYTALEHIETP